MAPPSRADERAAQVSLNPQLLVDKNNTTLRVLRLPCADVRTGLNLSSNYLEELDLRPIRVEKVRLPPQPLCLPTAPPCA